MPSPGHRICNTWKASLSAHKKFVAEHTVFSKCYPRGSRNKVPEFKWGNKVDFLKMLNRDLWSQRYLSVDSSRKDWEKNILIQSALKHKEQTGEFIKVDWAVDSQSVALGQQQQLNLLEIKFRVHSRITKSQTQAPNLHPPLLKHFLMLELFKALSYMLWDSKNHLSIWHANMPKFMTIA